MIGQWRLGHVVLHTLDVQGLPQEVGQIVGIRLANHKDPARLSLPAQRQMLQSGDNFDHSLHSGLLPQYLSLVEVLSARGKLEEK